MNLVLFSSFYDSKKVRDFIREKAKHADPKICIIPSFTNFQGVQSSGDYYTLERMGFNPDNISMFDVGYLFDETKIDSLKENDVIILGGGNTFLFQWLLRRAGMLDGLSEFAKNGGILIGESAGSIIMSESIEIARFADEDIVGSENTDGLGIIDFEMKPHFGGWLKRFPEFVYYSAESNQDLYCLFDGGFIIVSDDDITPHGNFILLRKGEIVNFDLTNREQERCVSSKRTIEVQ